MGLDYGRFRVGNVVYPLDPLAVAANPLATLNPFTYQALNFFSAMLQLKMGAAWNQVVTDLGRLEFVNKVVAYNLPYDPIPYFREQQAKFPLLSIWETDSTTEERTFSWYHTISTYKISYSLFPTTSAEAEKLYPFLRSARDIILDRAEQGYDPDYNDSQQVWSDGYSGIEKLTFARQKTIFQNLAVDPKTNLFFPTVLLTMQVSFREEFQRDFLQELAGIDTTQLLDGYQFLQTSQFL